MNRSRVAVALSFALMVPFCLAGQASLSSSQIRELFDAKARLMGDPAAPVKIVAFVDYDCPFCRKNMPLFEEAASHLKGVVVYAHQMPLRQHKFAEPAASLAVNAEAKGIYPEVDRALLKGGPLTESALKRIGREYGISSSRGSALLDSERQLNRNLKLTYVPVFLVVEGDTTKVYNWIDMRAKLASLRTASSAPTKTK